MLKGRQKTAARPYSHFYMIGDHILTGHFLLGLLLSFAIAVLTASWLFGMWGIIGVISSCFLLWIGYSIYEVIQNWLGDAYGQGHDQGYAQAKRDLNGTFVDIDDEAVTADLVLKPGSRQRPSSLADCEARLSDGMTGLAPGTEHR